MSTSFLAVLAVILLPQGQSPKISLDLKDASPKDAITQITKVAKLPCVFSGELPDKPTVTSTFQDVDAILALKMVCEATGLITSEQDEKTKLVIRRSPVSLPVDGVNARVIGAVPASTWLNRAYSLDASPASFEGDCKLVDLEVKDAPLREAMEKISQASGVAIVVDDTVSKDIKVNATIRKLPLRQILSDLVSQANLTYTVENKPDPEVVRGLEARFKAGLMPQTEYDKELRSAPQIPTIYIVPKPEMKVTGAPGGAGAMFGLDLQGIPGLDAEALAARLRGLKALPGGGQLNLRTLGLATKTTTCPKCHKKFTRAPGSDYCPFCGRQLPKEKPKVDGEQ